MHEITDKDKSWNIRIFIGRPNKNIRVPKKSPDELRMTENEQELLNFARHLGREAGQLLLDWSGRATASIKWDGSVVTEADHAADHYLSTEILARYPDHEIISEEAETRYTGKPFTWVIDPLDGTTNFALGVCYWGCSIALLHRGEPLAGVITVPSLNAAFWAARGAGAYLNEERLGGHALGITERNSFLALCSRAFRYLDLPMP